ncbi:MAG: gluconeogenesis factor YvcK family protein, partial [Patescibacteria group bacterium]
MKKVVTIGGGTGSFMLLSGLRKYPIELSAIVSMADDGGSTGVLRDELGVLPPGDVRQCLVALSESSDILRDLMNYRFANGGLSGHSFGNLFLSALEKITGSFSEGVLEASKILNVKGEVIPVTATDTSLKVKLADGTV